MLKKRDFSRVTDSDSFDLSQRFTEPYFLRKVLLEEMGGDGGSIHKRLAIAVHAVLVESGFVGFDPVSGLQTDGFRFPDEFLSPVSLCYSLPALLSNATDYVVLRFRSVGRYLQVYGSLVKGSGIHKLSLDEHSLRRIGKNGLALPLLIDLCSKTHLALPACFVRLPTELKLKILGSLPGTDLARMECVCSEMRNLASHNHLWKQKVEQRFGGPLCFEFEAFSTRKNWKLLFASLWKTGVYGQRV
ncbi:hypothetical protein V6N12_030367 [Hibiscus sabdariffa]|uniref:F-box domain-containing protein n=1 Tax=Hibiscus sabdariffa TaxID=183260 RepID=A0ABR2C0Q4_9ROSI